MYGIDRLARRRYRAYRDHMSNNQAAALMQPYNLGPLVLPHRVAMAPLTRNRADADLAPHQLNVAYYRQRASAALIITEATQVSPMGQGYPGTPGIYSDKQQAGWSAVTEAVHDAGGRIFAQLWHVGRISHPDLLPDNATPVAPSAIKPAGKASTLTGPKDFVAPRALAADELPGIVEEYRRAAQVAKDAGFDGVEIHNANGYLPDQFLRSGTNQRTDAFGGSVANRARFPLMVAQAVCDVWGADRVGLRVSPVGTFNDMHDDDPDATFMYFAEQLNDIGLIYLHVSEPGQSDFKRGAIQFPAKKFRSVFKNTLIANGGYTRESALQVLNAGDADLIAFGRPFIANPDLPERLFQNADLNTPDPSTFYGGTAKGYTDYPAMQVNV